ncbi:unnamed protein product, partial [Closterium sp. NIES-53]
MGANGGLVGLGNVLLVGGLSANLLSVRRLQKSKAKVTFGPTSCRAKLGKLLLWDLEEKSSCIKDLWQLPIIPWNGKPPATAAAAATAKATTGGEETAATAKTTAASAPTYGALDAVKKVQQPQQPHGEVLAGVDATAAWAKASSGNGDADWETWHERLCHINIPMLQKLVKDGSLKGLEVKGTAKVVRAGSVAEQCDEDEIAHCYWAAVPEPKTLAEALSGPNAEKWKQSVKEEYDSLVENETWELCELPPRKKAISSKLIFRHKYGPDGELTHYKSMLVAKGFQQTKGKDFDEIFAPVGKGTTLR